MRNKKVEIKHFLDISSREDTALPSAVGAIVPTSCRRDDLQQVSNLKTQSILISRLVCEKGLSKQKPHQKKTKNNHLSGKKKTNLAELEFDISYQWF